MIMYTAQQFIDGLFILIDKPKGWTSFDVIAKIRGPLQRFTGDRKLKIGHTGTLDPMATGLLLIATGKFTKKINELQDLDKEYTGSIRLGGITPSFDAETPVTQTFPYDQITIEQIKTEAQQFSGTIAQMPPIYSSIKIDGERAYKKAREGEEVIMKLRQVTIYNFELLSIEIPEIKFKVHCSKGTYIRSIAHDLGQELGCGGYLTELTRTKVGSYELEQATSIEAFLATLI